jgi:chemotaxis protein MotB
MEKKPAELVVINKVEDDGEHGHHGGAWKVAYADFMTAMMAFFLLMWIIAASDEAQLKGLADYFTPSLTSDENAGEGYLEGAFGKESVLSGTDGLLYDVQPPSFGEQTPLAVFDSRLRDEETAVVVEYAVAPQGAAGAQEGDAAASGGTAVDAQDPAGASGRAPDPGAAAEGESEQIDPETKALARARTQRLDTLKTLKDEIGMAIRERPELAALTNNVILESTTEGLQVQLVDREGRSMFTSGSARIADLPNDIVIAGHTDAVPFTDDATYGNWELSADRANASRRILVAAGVNPSRIVEISGLADTKPLNQADPDAPENRRISILLQFPEVPSP